MPDTSFEIFFGRGGMAIDYIDEHGKFTFVFDVDSDVYDPRTHKLRDPAGKEVLFIDPAALRNDQPWSPCSPVEIARIASMLERIREHVIGLGYDVKILGK